MKQWILTFDEQISSKMIIDFRCKPIDVFMGQMFDQMVRLLCIQEKKQDPII